MLRVRKQVYCSDRYTGKGITVAILDTGISRHPDFGSRILGFTDFVNGRVGLYDDDTHGTHVYVRKHKIEKCEMGTSLVCIRLVLHCNMMR